MRQIFRSRRLETVEGVAKLLADHGIETYISERRAYKGNRRGQFSFTENSGPEPALWLVQSADITRARELMAEAGLLSTQRSESLVALQGQERSAPTAGQRPNTATKIRIALIVGVLAVATVQFVRWWMS